MKNYWKAIGIAAVGAVVLYYPVRSLVRYLKSNKQDASVNDGDEVHYIKAFAPAYRGKHKSQHRLGHDGKA